MANIRIKNLPSDATPNKNDILPIDALTTRGVTIENAVKIGRPFASQAEAEGGTDYTKAMNPLTTRQAIVAYAGANFATAAQGVKADTAVQPGDLAAVALSGEYDDLSGRPALGTAAATDSTAYATAAQGAKADSAVQPATLDAVKVPAGGTTGQVLAKVSNADNAVTWTAAGVGDMLSATYDPQGKSADAFARANHTGTQAISTVEGLGAAIAPLGQPIVIVATGQSNISEVGDLNWTPPDNLRVWNWAGVDETTVGTAFVASDASTIGCGRSYAAEMARENPGAMIYLINIGRGAQPIAQWMAGASTPDMYSAVKKNVEAALAVLGVDRVNRILWWQGESDSMNGSTTYVADFETVMARLYAETWVPISTPVIIMGVSHLYSAGAFRGFNGILALCADRDPQRRIFVPQEMLGAGYWLAPSNIHMTGIGYREAGRLAYQNGERGVGQNRKMSSWIRRIARSLQTAGASFANHPELQIDVSYGWVKFKVVGSGSANSLWWLTGPATSFCYWTARVAQASGVVTTTGFGSTYPTAQNPGVSGAYTLEVDVFIFAEGRVKFGWAGSGTTLYSGSYVEALSS